MSEVPMMSEDPISNTATITTAAAAATDLSCQTSKSQEGRSLEMDTDNTQVVHSLLSMSTAHIIHASERDASEREAPEKTSPQTTYTMCPSSSNVLPSSNCVQTETETTTVSSPDKETKEHIVEKPVNISRPTARQSENADENQSSKHSVSVTESDQKISDTRTDDLAILTHQVEIKTLSKSTPSYSEVITEKTQSQQDSNTHSSNVSSISPISVSAPMSNETMSISSRYSCAAAIILNPNTYKGVTKPFCMSSSLINGKVQGDADSVHDIGTNVGMSEDMYYVANKDQSRAFQSENTKDSLECSFTDSDDSDDEILTKSKKTDDDGFFRITFDSDDESKSSSSDGFLTCSVCGKELPEAAIPEGGKEMCNTCKLVRTDPTEVQQKPNRRGRKKLSDRSSTEEDEIRIQNKNTPRKDTLNSEESDIAATPVRKSMRKRISKVLITDAAEDFTDDEEDSGAVDMSDADYHYAHLHKKLRFTEKKERKSKTNEEISKSKYAQELNLTPVVKSDPDGQDDVIITEPAITPAEVINVEEIISNSLKYGNVKRKKGRPKGSKNKPKHAKEFGLVRKEPKRDMKFNKRWHRGRGPVPDTNPDSADGMWSCEFCNKSFPIRRNFLAHRRKHSGRHKCEECTETFECNSKLQRHIRRHRGEKPFACHLCPKAYSENMWLQRHLATHLAEGHTPQPKPYQCNICGRQYTHKGTMIYHVKTHTETKFYQCDVCGKQFTHRSSLECHIKTHTGEKPYVCEICGKRFADRSVQLRHTRSHSGDKPYKCTICDKGFTQSGTLNIHMRMHTSEKPYKCKVCDMGFMKRCELSKHSKCHVGEMLCKQANLITCRVNEGRGVDIQKKAAQILIDAYGERKEDGTIEIKTRHFQQEMESDPEEVPEHEAGRQVSTIVKSMEMPLVDSRHMDTHLMGRHEPEMISQQQHEEFHRHAMEYIIMKRQELEQEEIERMQILNQHVERPTMEHVPVDRHVIEHQTVEVATEQHPSDRHMVEQQIERHVEQHAAQRQLLEQVEGQVMDQQQQQMMESQQMERQRLEQMSPQQQPLWIVKYN